MGKRDNIRLYRAEEKPTGRSSVPDWVKQSPDYQRAMQASGRWFTDSLEEAQWYIKNEYPSGRIVFIDIPRDIANRYRVSQLKKSGGKTIGENPFAFSLRPESEYFLPKKIAAMKKKE